MRLFDVIDGMRGGLACRYGRPPGSPRIPLYNGG